MDKICLVENSQIHVTDYIYFPFLTFWLLLKFYFMFLVLMNIKTKLEQSFYVMSIYLISVQKGKKSDTGHLYPDARFMLAAATDDRPRK